MEIEVKKLTKEALQKLEVFKWPIWTKEVSQFDWYYDSRESCYLLEGEVEVISAGKTVCFREGDFVIFPRGLKCVWKIKKAVKKHYNFD